MLPNSHCSHFLDFSHKLKTNNFFCFHQKQIPYIEIGCCVSAVSFIEMLLSPLLIFSWNLFVEETRFLLRLFHILNFADMSACFMYHVSVPWFPVNWWWSLAQITSVFFASTLTGGGVHFVACIFWFQWFYRQEVEKPWSFHWGLSDSKPVLCPPLPIALQDSSGSKGWEEGLDGGWEQWD